MRRYIWAGALSLLLVGTVMQGCNCADDPRYARRHHRRKIKVTFFSDGSRAYRGDDNYWYLYISDSSSRTWRQQPVSPFIGRTVLGVKEEEEDQLENETAELTEEPNDTEVSEDGAADSGSDTSSSGDSGGSDGGGDGGGSD